MLSLGGVEVGLGTKNMKLSPVQTVLVIVGGILIGYGAIDVFPWLAEVARKYRPQLIASLSIAVGLGCIAAAIKSLLGRDRGKTRFDLHEDDSRDRFNYWQERLNMYGALRNAGGIKNLVAEMDAQLKLEDFLIKFRESEHAKIKVWGTIFAASIVSLITALLTLGLHKSI